MKRLFMFMVGQNVCSSVFDVAFKMNFKLVLTLHDYFTACPNGGYFNYQKMKFGL